MGDEEVFADSHDEDVDKENNTILPQLLSIHTINASLITRLPASQIAVKVQEETASFQIKTLIKFSSLNFSSEEEGRGSHCVFTVINFSF